ncbi:hypothetical protein DWG18_02485 [Lysobacter sp. TY2-98]|uniref:hypothetical protein n=1 Tax=Lysobacter sp. TY2-98 TaxID=2290922 RepID=UPI000E2022F5|nr:hypothetical protein [Lysobacter sp. TY2-98]AXK71267.1 hypothetical protein DWG18_02485 [Lysobacter sp. TY2-98]
MFILLTDETNRAHSDDARFFVYGGLIVPMSSVPALHAAIAEIRSNHSYAPADALKFDTNSRPEHVTLAEATDAKRQVIAACIAHSCRFIAYVVHHQIARNQPIQQVVEWGADHVIGKFNYFLTVEGSYGIVAMDRLPDGMEFSYLAQKFSGGLSFPDDPAVLLDRITLFSSTSINASHLSSAMDIVLGSWRYCINAPRNVEAAKSMMADITQLIWHRREGDTLHAAEKGLVMRPKEVRNPQYKADYDALLENINALIAHL